MARAPAQNHNRAVPCAASAPTSQGTADRANQTKMRTARRFVCTSRRTVGIRNTPRPRWIATYVPANTSPREPNASGMAVVISSAPNIVVMLARARSLFRHTDPGGGDGVGKGAGPVATIVTTGPGMWRNVYSVLAGSARSASAGAPASTLACCGQVASPGAARRPAAFTVCRSAASSSSASCR